MCVCAHARVCKLIKDSSRKIQTKLITAVTSREGARVEGVEVKGDFNLICNISFFFKEYVFTYYSIIF